MGLYVRPPSGSVIGGLEGTPNTTILKCSSVTDEKCSLFWGLKYQNGTQVQTVSNNTAPNIFNVTISGNHSIYIESYFHILTLTSDLDGVQVFCGTNREYQPANFIYRIYRKVFNCTILCELV